MGAESAIAPWISIENLSLEFMSLEFTVTNGKANSFTHRLFRVDKGTGKAAEIFTNGSFEQARAVSTAM